MLTIVRRFLNFYWEKPSISEIFVHFKKFKSDDSSQLFCFDHKTMPHTYATDGTIMKNKGDVRSMIIKTGT